MTRPVPHDAVGAFTRVGILINEASNMGSDRLRRRAPGTLIAAAALLVGGAALLTGGAARAQTEEPTVNCLDPALRPKPIYIAGSSAIKPFLGVVAKLLAAEPEPYTIIYQSQGSCTGVNAIYSESAADRVIKDIPEVGDKPANYAIFFLPDGESTEECFLEPDTGNVVDVGVSDVFATSCEGIATPAGVQIRDYEGPIQPMTFVVPSASTQRSISSEAAYLAFGLGGYAGASAPWIDPMFFFIRNDKSGTQQMTSAAIGVPAGQWWGIDQGGSTAVKENLKLLVDNASAEKAIGILSTDLADSERSNLRVLAYQARGQSCAYYPDSTPFSADKRNVRDGHYDIWGPVHFYTRVEGSGLPSPAAGALVTRFAAPKLDQGLLEVIVRKHLVPKCAMKVQRSEEIGPLSPYTTDARCDCFFEVVSNGATSCQPCTLPGECPAERPTCNYGYCEEGQ